MITKKQLSDFIDYEVAIGYSKELNQKGLNFYERELLKRMKSGGRIKI